MKDSQLEHYNLKENRIEKFPVEIPIENKDLFSFHGLKSFCKSLVTIEY